MLEDENLNVPQNPQLNIGAVSGSLRDDEAAAVPIQVALYATGRFTTEKCDTLADGIIRYIKDAEIMMVVKQ